MTAKKKITETQDGMDFEKAMSRLEEIAGLLESGGEDKLSLERSLELYEEGSGLAAFCLGRLKDAEQRITELSIAPEDGSSGAMDEE